MSKTIWIFNQTAGKPDSGWGERHYNFSKYWVQQGYNIVIFSGSYNHLFINQPAVGNQTFTIETVEEGITFCWIKTPKYYDGGFRKFWSNIVYMFRLFFLPIKKFEKPSIIIVSSMPIFPILNGYYFKKKFRAKKLIFEIRDLWPLTPIHLKGYSKYHPLVLIVAWFEKFAYLKSNSIVSLLPNAHHYIDKISKDPKKFVWIPNGIDEKLLENKSLSSEIKQQIPKDKFLIAYTGTMGMANALEYLIEATELLRNHKDIHFLLVGDGYLKPALIQKTLGQQNITFLPKIQKNQVQSLLQLVDICFIGRNDTPLFDYGVSSNKYFDYMLAKKPVVASSNKIGCPIEKSGGGIIVQPENPQAILDGILTLYQLDKKELLDLGQKGYDYVKKYHNFEYLSNRYLNLFD